MNSINFLFADVIPPRTFWNAAPNSGELFLKLIISLLLLSAFLFFARNASPSARKTIVGTVTFLAGAFYVLYFLWPSPVNRKPEEIPSSLPEHVSFYLDDALPVVASIANILAAFLLGLGAYSVLNIHVRKVAKKQRDWGFSVVLLVCILLMVVVGYLDWYSRTFGGPPWFVAIFGSGGVKLEDPKNWNPLNYANDLLFWGLLQQMDAAMFSVIAFYILSAAYRAFRIRSVEATILLASALIVILSLMGLVDYYWTRAVGGPQATFTLTEIAKWLRDCFQTPAIRAIDFGVGIGALAMGLRLWLSLEKQGAN